MLTIMVSKLLVTREYVIITFVTLRVNIIKVWPAKNTLILALVTFNVTGSQVGPICCSIESSSEQRLPGNRA